MKIEGGGVAGQIRLGGNKNAALPMIAAALLTDDELVFHDFPDITDVNVMLEIAEALGVKCRREGTSCILKGATSGSTAMPAGLCRRIRTSLLFAGPLAVTRGFAEVCRPGGDAIGHRRIDAHVYGLRRLGLDVCEDEPWHFTVKRERPLAGKEIFLDEASVTATEHILLAACLAPGVTRLVNAACEPHVTQLANLLNAMGARISGIESNVLVIEGVNRLHGAEISVDSDHVEAATWLSLCAALGGTVELCGNIMPHTYWMTRRVFEKFSVNFTLQPGRILMERKASPRVAMDIGNSMPVISDGPWPQFPSDMMSCLVVVATQAAGTVLFFEKMFESRLYFADKLKAMGANLVICDPHRVVVSGPAELHGIEMSSPDIRAGMAMVLAAACAKGTSIIHNAETLYRGYDGLLGKLNQLGIRTVEVEC